MGDFRIANYTICFSTVNNSRTVKIKITWIFFKTENNFFFEI